MTEYFMTKKHFKVWFVWFYGISTFVGYLTPNPFLFFGVSTWCNG